MSSEVATPTPISQALSNKLANMAFVCACLVVFIHTWIVPTNTFAWWFQQMTVQGVCRIAVPFFFIAAGFFLAGHTNEEKWYQKACHKRLHTLLIPFILWEIIYWGFEWSYPILANLLTGASITRNLPLDGFSLLTMMGLNPTTSPALAPLWFVRALLLFILLSPLLLRFITKGKQIALCFLVTLFLIYALVPTGLSSACFANFWRKWISLEGLFYFSLGLYLRLWAPNLQFKWQHIALALIIGGGGLIVTGYGRLILGGTWWEPYPRWFGLPFLLLAIWHFIPTTPWHKSLTSAAFPIFLIHWFIIDILAILRAQCPFLPWPTQISDYLFKGIITLLLSLLITWTLRKTLPKFSTILFGGR